MKQVLITGGAGFIGSNFAAFTAEKHKDWLVVNVDSLTYAGNVKNLSGLQNASNHVFIQADITAKERMRALFERYSFDHVINFAAESHVDRSIDAPESFIKTNVLGAQCLLDCAKACWQTGTDEAGYPVYKEHVGFVQISTDEVYGPARGEPFTESSPLLPSNPYAASKASADLIAGAYAHTYHLPVVITRCSNNYGPCQHPEKLIPLMIGRAFYDKPLPLYGDGMHVRDWIYVRDHCEAIDRVLANGRKGEIYNIGGGNPVPNIDIVRDILKTLGKPESLITHVQDRMGHDRAYAVDISKITRELGWAPKTPFKEGLSQTIEWYINNKERMLPINTSDEGRTAR